MEWWSLLMAVLAALSAVLAGAYAFYAHRFAYWRRRGVPHPRPVAPFGNMHVLVTSGKGTLDLIRPYRDKGYCGFYMGAAPLLLLWDAEMVKQVLCKDFGSFHDRGQPTDDLSGAKWRSLRNKLSPTFTSGKLKLMLPLIREVAEELCAVLAAKAKSSDTGELDLHPILAHFATDVIGTCAFGVQCHCLRDEKNQFLVMSQRLQGRSLGQGLRFLLQTIHPKLASLVPMKWIFPEEHKFFLDLVRDTVEYREQNPEVQRNDFVQLLMQLRDRDQGLEDPERHVDLGVPGNMAAQAFIFFIAGLDNVSNTIGYCLTRLAADPALQDEVAAEVRAVSREHGGGEITYEALKRMDLVGRVMAEGLRLWPAIGVLFRKCNATTQSRSASTPAATQRRPAGSATPTASCRSARGPGYASPSASPSSRCGSPSPCSSGTSSSRRGPASSRRCSSTPRSSCPGRRMASGSASARGRPEA
ncbi:hypothetical protein ONE63_005799 [Megalurothrips usitatus]|uniref:Cytochrome P450 n=1 Tax=Megalurothrips usitatus TaxID=439358 RepID=A0AAV7XWQ0_9NEOP|nr:hypothetical protein ONE63_005799 [Megalurothrips usitatus]